MTTTTNNFNFVTFSNNVTVVNTTPHPVTIQDVNGSLISVPTSVLINAKAIEKQVSPLFVKTEFVGTDEGREIISSIKESFNQNAVAGETLVIIGSILLLRHIREKYLDSLQSQVTKEWHQMTRECVVTSSQLSRKGGK